MTKRLILGWIYLCVFFSTLGAQEDVVGFWKTINEHTHKPESVVAIYEYQGRIFGRLIVTFDDTGKIQDTIENPKERAPGVQGNPFYCGLDIIWDLEKERGGSKYINGKIMDPEKGKVYHAKLWRDGSDLIVRGELLIFGRNQTWPPAVEADFPTGFKKPDLTKLVPKILPVKD